MSIVLPTDLSEADHAWAGARFADLQAARALIDVHEPPVPVADRPQSVGAFRLARYVARRRAVAGSAMARAAHSADQPLQRMIGAFRMSVIDQGDAVFVILDIPAGIIAPRILHVFDEDNANSLSIDLPEPINNAVQLVLDPLGDAGSIVLLTRLSAEILVE